MIEATGFDKMFFYICLDYLVSVPKFLDHKRIIPNASIWLWSIALVNDVQFYRTLLFKSVFLFFERCEVQTSVELVNDNS